MDFDPYRSTGTAASANMRAADPFAGFPTSAKQPETVQQGISDPFAQFSINAPPVAPAQSTAQLPMQPQVTPYSLGTPQQSSVPVPSMPSVSSFDPFAQNTAPNAPSFPAASVGTVPFDPFASADPNASTTHSAPSVPPEQAFDPFAAVSASATGDGHAAFGGTPVAAAAPPPAAANDSLWDIPDMAPPRKSTEPAEASSSAIADPRLQATYGNGESAATASSAAPATTSAAQSRPPGAVRDDPLLRKSSSSTEASSATPPMGSILARVSTRSLLTQDWKRLWFSFVPPSEDDRTGETTLLLFRSLEDQQAHTNSRFRSADDPRAKLAVRINKYHACSPITTKEYAGASGIIPGSSVAGVLTRFSLTEAKDYGVVTLAKFADEDAATVRALCAYLHFLILQAKTPAHASPVVQTTPAAAAVVALQRRASAPRTMEASARAAASATAEAPKGPGYNRWQ